MHSYSATSEARSELQQLLRQRAEVNRAIALLEEYDLVLKRKGSNPVRRKARAGGFQYKDFLQ